MTRKPMDPAEAAAARAINPLLYVLFRKEVMDPEVGQFKAQALFFVREATARLKKQAAERGADAAMVERCGVKLHEAAPDDIRASAVVYDPSARLTVAHTISERRLSFYAKQLNACIDEPAREMPWDAMSRILTQMALAERTKGRTRGGLQGH